jgi:predicted AlkP superfamily phosphohydrolase/phosphomutase
LVSRPKAGGGGGRLAPLLLLAAILTACTAPDRGPEGGADPADSGARPRVIIVGIDGADWRVIDPMMAAGKLPVLRRLVEEGASGILHSMEPSASPALWTTVATGVSPDRHGIHGFVVRSDGEDGRTDPQVRPVTSTMRQAPAFWNILPKYGLTVGVVGWLVTWPAEAVDGFMVSSYLPYLYNWSTGRPLKGTIVEGIAQQTFPEELIDEVDRLKIKPDDLGIDLLRRFYDPTRLGILSPDDRECVKGFVWSLACDETFHRIGLRLFERRPVDLFAVYFGGIDVVSHRFWKFAYPEALDYGVRDEQAEILGRVIEEYYRHADAMVGEYLEDLGPEDTLVVLSDHGFKPALMPRRPTTSAHHRLEGILAIWGRGARRGHRFEGARLLDVLPTLLALLDVPISIDLEGRVLEQALDPAFTLARPARFTDDYGDWRAAAGPERSEVDANVLERLRSLGYID